MKAQIDNNGDPHPLHNLFFFNQVHFLSDFRNSNYKLKRKSYPMHNIIELLLKLEGVHYSTSLDLNMGYYHIQLTTIIIPWGKYHHKCLPIGVSNSPKHFQHKMKGLFRGFKFVRVYIYEIFILTKGGCTYHVHNLEISLNKLKESGLKCNTEKSFFRQTEMGY